MYIKWISIKSCCVSRQNFDQLQLCTIIRDNPGGKMRKFIFIIAIILLFCFCTSRYDNVEKQTEDGVEVVVNHLEPYRLKGEPSTLNLEEEFTIDTEKEEMLEIGLIGIETFDVDGEGNIFLIQWDSRENYIFKFDSKGNFKTSFCRRGQGPGEIEWGSLVLINPEGEVMAKDISKQKFLIYDREGNFLREIHLGSFFHMLVPLLNGQYFIFWGEDTPEFRKQFVGLCNSKFEDVKKLDAFQYPNVMFVKSPVNRDRLEYTVSKDRICIGNTERGYEIHVYDLEGRLLRKIRKEYDAVEVTEDFKKSYFERFPEGDPFLDLLYFNKHWPPFRYLFTDEEGRLFVLTFEKGPNPGEYMYDIFNPDGAFVRRIGLKNQGMFTGPVFPARAKNGRLYCLREKESGYKELVVYRMKWE